MFLGAKQLWIISNRLRSIVVTRQLFACYGLEEEFSLALICLLKASLALQVFAQATVSYHCLHLNFFYLITLRPLLSVCSGHCYSWRNKVFPCSRSSNSVSQFLPRIALQTERLIINSWNQTTRSANSRIHSLPFLRSTAKVEPKQCGGPYCFVQLHRAS